MLWFIFAEIDLYFTGDTPQVDVKSIYVEFESNMNDLTIECHLKGRDKVDCECYNVKVFEPFDTPFHLFRFQWCIHSVRCISWPSCHTSDC